MNLKDLMHGHTVADIPINHQQNLADLLIKVNNLEHIMGVGFVVTSGYRSVQEHLNIYSRKGIYPPKVPIQSNHLSGRAVDISDLNGYIFNYLRLHESVLIECKLWAEDSTKGWVHLQSIPPKSGKRFFLP